MLIPRSAIDEDIIEKHKHESPQIFMKHLVHESLECGGSIRKSKRHDEEFVMSLMGAEGGFVHILIRHSSLMIARS